MIRIVFVSPEGDRSVVEARAGDNLLRLAWDHQIDMEGACEGVMACSTCHVIVDQSFFDALPAASEEEEDLLDLAWGVRPTSRLACQIELTDDMDGMELTLPTETFNQM